jgi:hypothetical protein
MNEEPTVFITSFSKYCIIVEAGGFRIWLNREEALELLDMLPGAINKMSSCQPAREVRA